MKKAALRIDITAIMGGRERNTLTAEIEPMGSDGTLAMNVGTSDETIPFTIDVLSALIDTLKARAKEKGMNLAENRTIFVEKPNTYSARSSIRNRILEAMAKGEFSPELAEEAMADLESRLKRLVDSPETFDLRELLKKSRSKEEIADAIRSTFKNAREISPEEVPPEIRKRIRDALKGAFSDMPEDIRVEVVDASENPELTEALLNGELDPEAAAMKLAGIVSNVEFDGFSIHQHDDGKICMGYEGRKVKNTLAELQALAFRFQIPFKDSNGRDVPEEVLGATVIDFLKDLNHDGHAVH